MKKIILIEDNNDRSFFWNFLLKNFKCETQSIRDKEELNALLKFQNPDFVYLNIKKPVNGDEDLMNMLSYSHDLNRLRVTIITISIFSQIIDKILTIKSSFRSLFHIKKEEATLYKK